MAPVTATMAPGFLPDIQEQCSALDKNLTEYGIMLAIFSVT
jgi:hypothetical protein